VGEAKYGALFTSSAQCLPESDFRSVAAGIPVVQTTQIDDYTAVMLSIRNGGGVFWVRQSMYVLYDPYTLASTNEFRYVAEELVALSVPRPAAVSLISDLAGTS
jgi:hypothetical protein